MKEQSFPKRVTIELTNRCNVLCTFCHRNGMKMPLGDMSIELYKKIIDELAMHLPIAMVPFFRGESLLHPQFIECIQYAKEKGISPIQFTSNGLALDETIARKLIESEVDFVSFSMDTLDADIYANSRLYGNLDKSMENIKRFAQLCKEYKKRGYKVPKIQVSTIDIDLYRDKQDEFVEHWKQYADIIRIYEEHDDKGRFRNQQVSEKLQCITNRKPCKKLYTDMVICWNGNISLCCYDWNEQIDFGNVAEHTLSEIWNGEAYTNLRKMHETDTIDARYVCKECEHWKADYLEDHILGKKYIVER